MISAAISQLKASLSEFLARVKGGEELIVTEHGRPVAKIVPLTRQPEAGMAELERAGLVRRAGGRLPSGFWRLPRPRDGAGAILRELLAEREEER